MSISFNEFLYNKADFAVVLIPYQTMAAAASINNKYYDNNAVYSVYISANCKPGFSLSLGSSRCIKSPTNRHRNLIVVILAAVIAGIVLVILVLN